MRSLFYDTIVHLPVAPPVRSKRESHPLPTFVGLRHAVQCVSAVTYYFRTRLKNLIFFQLAAYEDM